MLAVAKAEIAIDFVEYILRVAGEAGVTTLQSVQQVQVVKTSIVVQENNVSDRI